MSFESPKHVVVIGAGIVGLSVAWFLQDYGVKVTVLDQKAVAAGSSWGNAGWISPGLTTPLPEPSVLRYGLKSLVRPEAPLYVPLSWDPSLARFLTKFAMHCTLKQCRRAMESFIPINNEATQAYDVLCAADSSLEIHEAPILAAFENSNQATDLLHELEMINQAGQIVETETLSGKELRESVALLSNKVTFGIRIKGQRYIDPAAFTNKLAASVVARGGVIALDKKVLSLSTVRNGVIFNTSDQTQITADAGVLCTGAWIHQLAGTLGVKMPVRAGRGYSFVIATQETVPHPVYFPVQRVACTPAGINALRVAGTMEFRDPDFPLDQSRINAIIRSAKPLLNNVDYNLRTSDWVGSRPVSADGMPLIGATKVRGIYVAGGHGMWGVTLGPATGRLLADQIVKGETPPQIRPFDPTR